MAESYAAKVSAFVAKSRARQEAVYRESAQRLLSIAQTTRGEGGAMRVDTGFLCASLVANLTGTIPAVTFKPEGDGPFSYDAGQVNLVIAGAELSDPITAAWTANYARPREYGSHGHAGDRFLGLAAQRWTQVVAAVCEEVKARTGG